MFKRINHKLLFILALTMALLLAISSMALAQVWTVPEDAAPGTVVTIFGNNVDGLPGYVAGQVINIDIAGPHDPAFDKDSELSSCSAPVTVSDDGSWNCMVKLWDDPEWAVGTYSYIATSVDANGNSIEESGTFTDGNVDEAPLSIYESDCITESTEFTLGDTVCIKTTISVNPSNQSADFRFRWYDSSNTLIRTVLCSSCTNDATYSDSYSPLTAGTWTIKTCKGATSDCLGGNALDTETVTINALSDTTAPTINCTVLNQAIWYSTNQNVTCTANDPSGLKNSADASFILSTSVDDDEETANANTNSHQVCDIYDNCATAGPYAFMVDKKAPQLTSCDAPDGLWHADDVTLMCTYTDDGSGPATQDVSLSTNVAAGAETDDAVASAGGAQACDNVGNCADSPDDIAGNMVDKKVPQLLSCDAPDGLWHAANVTLYCHYTDGGSGPATQDVALTTIVASGFETDNAVASAGGAQACDAVSNCAVSPADIGGNKVDMKAPQLGTCDSPDGLWHANNVTLYCHYTDGGSGPSNIDVALTTNVAPGTETANAFASAGGNQACDDVGNCAASPADIGGNMVDRKAPTITISVPAAADYTLNAAVPANYNCSDNGSGVASCAGTVAKGSNIDTASVGSKIFTVNATDNVGNIAIPVSVTYYVKYAVGGMCYGGPGHAILQPIDADGDSVFKQKSTVPAKFRVCDANGVSIGTPGVVSEFLIVKITNGAITTPNESVDSTTPYTEFRWSASDQQWIFNISTKYYSANKTYYFVIYLNDGSEIPFHFGLK
jgi:hypothetical protein